MPLICKPTNPEFGGQSSPLSSCHPPSQHPCCPKSPRARYQITGDHPIAQSPLTLFKPSHSKPVQPSLSLPTKTTIKARVHVLLTLSLPDSGASSPGPAWCGVTFISRDLWVQNLPPRQSFLCLYVLPSLLETKPEYI